MIVGVSGYMGFHILDSSDFGVQNLDLLVTGGWTKTNTYSPNGDLMVIYYSTS